MTAKPTTKTMQKPALSPGWTTFFEFLLDQEQARRESEVRGDGTKASREQCAAQVKGESCE